jgi:hypothetical protein
MVVLMVVLMVVAGAAVVSIVVAGAAVDVGAFDGDVSSSLPHAAATRASASRAGVNFRTLGFMTSFGGRGYLRRFYVAGRSPG